MALETKPDPQLVPSYVVRIKGRRDTSTTETFLGSGVLIRADLILTCHHVLHPPSQAPFDTVLVYFQGHPDPIVATILHESEPDDDLALLELAIPFNHVHPPCWECPRLQKNDQLVLMGFPNDHDYKNHFHVANSDRYRILVESDVPHGISGGIGQFIHNDVPTYSSCVGLIVKTRDTVNSRLIAIPVIQAFLAESPLDPPPTLPGCHPDPAAYIEYVRTQTCSVQLNLEKVGQGSLPDDVSIEELWVPARTSVSGSEQPGSDKADSDKDAFRAAHHSAYLVDILNQRRILVIEGDAGTGKSTLLKRVAFAMLRRNWLPGQASSETLDVHFRGLPLWLPVRDFEEYLAKLYPAHAPPNSSL